MGKADLRKWWQDPMQVPPPDLPYGALPGHGENAYGDGMAIAGKSGPTIPGAVLAGGRTGSCQAAPQGNGTAMKPIWLMRLGRLALIWQATKGKATSPPPQSGPGRK